MSRLFLTSQNRRSDFRTSQLLREKIVTCPAKFIEFLKKLCNLQSALPKLVQNANVSSFSDKPKPLYFNSSMHRLVFFWQAKTVVLIFALLSYCERKIVTSSPRRTAIPVLSFFQLRNRTAIDSSFTIVATKGDSFLQ